MVNVSRHTRRARAQGRADQGLPVAGRQQHAAVLRGRAGRRAGLRGHAQLPDRAGACAAGGRAGGGRPGRLPVHHCARDRLAFLPPGCAPCSPWHTSRPLSFFSSCMVAWHSACLALSADPAAKQCPADIRVFSAAWLSFIYLRHGRHTTCISLRSIHHFVCAALGLQARADTR